MKETVIRAVEKYKLVAILRGVPEEKLVKVAQALYDGGIRLMEITYDQKHPDTWEETAGAIGAVAGCLPPVHGINFLVRRSRPLEERYIGNTNLMDERRKKQLLPMLISVLSS